MNDGIDRTIAWTAPMLARFKTAYDEAVKSGVVAFTFDGHEFVVGYAKYLIEYLEMEMKKP